ncbi:MAG: tetratricopeptide repeat protein [Planctomycetota bacterium]|nr:tetratricopeptide repeat protein [Planctomycetota bacterium]
MPKTKPDQLDADTGNEEKSRGNGLSKKIQLVLIGTCLSGIVLIGVGLFSMLMPEVDEQDLMGNLETAFASLKGGKYAQAKKLCLDLQQRGFREYPNFSGAPEYILGMIEFRQAIDPAIEDAVRKQRYRQARNNLLEADKYLIDAEHRPEWAYALGKSLYHTGSAAKAGPILLEAISGNCREKNDASFLLIESYLNSHDAADLEKALEVSRELLTVSDLPTELRDREFRHQAQLLVSLERYQEAEQALKNLSPDTDGRLALVLLQAQTLMAESEFEQAIDHLSHIVQDFTASLWTARQASYLLGLCRENVGDETNIMNAIDDYRRTADRYVGSPEALAATLRAASLLRKIPSNEKALAGYLAVLKSIPQDEDYRNRWLTKEELQKEIVDTWGDWIKQEAFAEAIALSPAMSSVFDNVTAIEYSALAHQKWAEHLQAEHDNAPPQDRGVLVPELRERWRLSGRQFEKLAQAWRTSSRYTEAIRKSAEQFRRGHDYEMSLKQWQEFIDADPAVGMSLAYVELSEVLMDLDRLDEALKNLTRVIKIYPTDAARFTAEYLSGECYLEKGELDKALQTWRSIITTGDLGPGAREWRLSLFSLGRHLANSADLLQWQATKGAADEIDQTLLDESYLRAEEAIRRLDEYCNRYPDSKEIFEARFLLAHSHQHVADKYRRKLAAAETVTARHDHLKAMQDELRQAIDVYTNLRDGKGQLLDREKKNRIEPLERFMLEECFFEIAHIRHNLENYEEAIGEYTKAANHYPLDARSILAYLQMTRCYDKLGKPNEARSKLEQVKYILEGLPDETFQPQLTNLSKAEWQSWVHWAIRLYQQDQPDASRPLPLNEPAS